MEGPERGVSIRAPRRGGRFAGSPRCNLLLISFCAYEAARTESGTSKAILKFIYRSLMNGRPREVTLKASRVDPFERAEVCAMAKGPIKRWSLTAPVIPA